VSRLMTSRAEALLREGFFADRAALDRKMESMAALDRERTRTDLRWDLALGDDILDDDTRQRELRNWLDKLVLS